MENDLTLKLPLKVVCGFSVNFLEFIDIAWLDERLTKEYRRHWETYMLTSFGIFILTISKFSYQSYHNLQQ